MVALLTIISVVVCVAVSYLFYQKRKNEPATEISREVENIDTIGEEVSRRLAESVREDSLGFSTDKRFAAIHRNKRRVADALDQCTTGVLKAKELVKAQIYHILEQMLPTEEDCCALANFKEPAFMEAIFMWELLIVHIKKHHGPKAMEYLSKTYGIMEERSIINEINGETQKRRLFDYITLVQIVKQEITEPVTHAEMLEVLTTIIYQKRYGFGVVDTLRAADIDGFNFGTSGSVRYKIEGNYEVPYRTENSVWVQLEAKWCHFSFLDFGSENEMKRIINQLVSWGTTAPMTEKVPYKVNDAYDGARVTAIRPPACECWACCVRKFTAGIYSKEKLMRKFKEVPVLDELGRPVVDKDGNAVMQKVEKVHNWQLPSTLIYYLMRGEQTTAFTGQQNTGKTSMMKAAMADVAMVNIRILEMSFELAIRELYPWKNVITVKPTDYVTSAQIQDLLKKTDGYLSMVGEVAEDIVAARMIQFCLIASAFTIFSHHAKTDEALVGGLANSLVASGEYENHDVALSTVLDAIKNNVHLDFVKGERVIAYISEIVKLNELAPYPTLKECWDRAAAQLPEDTDYLTIMQAANFELNREYYTRRTDRVRFDSRKIIVFDPETMTYLPNQTYTEEALKSILMHLNPQEKRDFAEFYLKNWSHVLNAA